MCLEIRQIWKSYRPYGRKKKARRVLCGIALVLSPGEIIGITGDSGAGKTTLGLILSGIMKPDNGQVCFDGTNLWSVKASLRKRFSRKLQMVFQHPESTFDPRWTIQQSLSEPFRLCAIRPDVSTLADCLAEVELDDSVLARRPHQLSGGELQRIAIARVMALKPDVVVFDEPTAMLDALTRAQIINLLENIRKTSNVSYVFISHDQALVNQFCRQVFRLENGCLSSTLSLQSGDVL